MYMRTGVQPRVISYRFCMHYISFHSITLHDIAYPIPYIYTYIYIYAYLTKYYTQRALGDYSFKPSGVEIGDTLRNSKSISGNGSSRKVHLAKDSAKFIHK